MSESHNNAPSRDGASDAWLELHLQEQIGELRQPDLRHRVLAADAERRAIAARRLTGSSRTPRWLAAAVLLIGVATVIAVLTLSTAASPVETTDPSLDQQDPTRQGQELIVKSVAEFQKHAKTATKITVTSGWLMTPLPLIPAHEANAVVLAPAQRKLVVEELQNLKEVPPAGWKWDNRIRIDLPDARFLLFAVYKTTDHRIGIRGLADFEMSERLRALLGPTLEGVALKTRLTVGDVRSREDLLRKGEYSIPADTETLRCRGLEDQDLALLSRWRKLKHLDLSGSRKTLKGTTLDELLKLPLETLNLRHLQIDEPYLSVLGQHPTLQELDISSQPGVTGACGTALARSKTLRSLSIREATSLTDDGIAALTEADTISHLDLSYIKMNGLTTNGLSQLRDMHGLQSLNLTRVRASMDLLLSSLGELPDLRELNIRETDVSNVGLAALHFRHAAKPGKPPLPLRKLDLTMCKGLQPGLLGQLGGYLNLEHLTLSRSSFRSVDELGKSTKDSFQDLQSLQKLQHLELNGTRIDAEACKHIARLPSLTHLDLSFTGAGISDEAVTHLSGATKLEHLQLTGCNEFGDAGLRTLTKLKSLKHLDLNVCDGITMQGVNAFRAARPDCELRLPTGMR